MRENLRVQIAAARARGDVLDHVLLCGPPGPRQDVARARHRHRARCRGCAAPSGPVLERPGDLAALLTNLERGQVFFIDEIHRLPHVVEETLYPAMEDFQLDLVVGQGPTARSIKLPLRPFCLVGATTRAGLLTSALRDRFGATFRLDFYCDGRARAHPRALGGASSTCRSMPQGAAEIARRSRGTPRIANRLLRRVRDFAQVRADGPHHAAGGARRAGAARRRRGGLRQDGSRAAARRSSTSSRAGRSGSTRSPPPSARSATRSRTSTSPSSSRRASSRARRRAAWRRRAPARHFGRRDPGASAAQGRLL